MKTSDKKYLLFAGILFTGIAMGMHSASSHADPVTGILSLLFAERMSSASNNRKEENTSTWRKNLSSVELAALNSIKNHPAVDTCIEMADQDDPIASYNARKIAEFSAYVKLRYAKTGQTPSIESIHYQWPARAFRWCSKKAGITTAGRPRNLEQMARGMIRVVQSIDAQQTVVVMRDSTGLTVD